VLIAGGRPGWACPDLVDAGAVVGGRRVTNDISNFPIGPTIIPNRIPGSFERNEEC
jgi:hypothetical protein